MSSRQDISDKLIHFTKGENFEEAFQRLMSIVKEKRILGTSGMIKGGYNCVCFSEAPLMSLPGGLVNPDAYSHYSPFGILVEKSWVFEQGGRPVIYQSDQEFYDLPEGLRWRHVRYEPNSETPVDFTWEREWRIQCNFLEIDPLNAAIVVPDESWKLKLEAQHKIEQFMKTFKYMLLLDENLSELHHEGFVWKVIYLLQN